ncbi:hypothetical protein Slin14017_G001190 [Septoria linicola]|nr:hypothetical protein Slin14017_G001190 [Septoria linicola]
MSTTTTAVTTTYNAHNAHPRLFAQLPSRRSDGRRSRSNSTNTTSTTTLAAAAKRPSYTSSFSSGMDRSLRRPQSQQRRQERVGSAAPSDTTPASGSATNTTWLRRLSSTLSTSRDSSRAPISRPGSAAVSYTNGSFTFSHSGSTTPVFGDSTTSQTESNLPANKLVKRTASLSSTHGSPNSRIPVFRRPATSHQRSATLQERLLSSDRSSHSSPAARDGHWRSYFSPGVTPQELPVSKRRGSTGIPNPVRRVYADRKYTPTLVSAKEPVRVDAVELIVDMEDDRALDNATNMAQSTSSSPFPTPAAHFEASTSPKRSFSISDLLSTGPQPLWRRPSTSNGRPWSSRSLRKTRPVSMGGLVSKSTGHEFERPAKRRDLTDPTTLQRSIYSSSSSSNYTFQPGNTHEVDLHLHGEASGEQYIPRSAPISRAQTPDQHRSTSDSGYANASRLSATHSELASTVGSESERRSTGGNSTDYQSDVNFDSIPTRTTRSSSGRRGPPIETIFDESPPTYSSGRSTRLRDFLSDGHETNGRYSTIEEEGSVVSTPVRSLRNKSITSTPSARPGAPNVFSSSPPTMRFPSDADEVDWDSGSEDVNGNGLVSQQHVSMPSLSAAPSLHALPFRFAPPLRNANSRSVNSTRFRNGHSPMDRPTVFDWAEPQPSPNHPNHSPPRPRTVHGRKDQDSRGSRPPRRPVSGLHTRSHSVPVVPDFAGKRNNVVANKFGTWNFGSKGVTEDWNDDFEFDEPVEPVQDRSDLDSKRIDSGHAMLIPKSIREQQHNVVANITLLREWGLLIEELKALRIRAVTLDMLNGPHAKAWREVDAMIDLADQESEEHTLEPRPTPPSSPGFDVSAFEDSTPSRANVRPVQPKLGQQASAADTPAQGHQEQADGNATIITRPRKDSELVAQKVIAALQTRGSAIDSPAPPPASSANKKVPFDTATLRHIVPYVKDLKRQVKDALRETEGLYSSPSRKSNGINNNDEDGENAAPAFRSIFNSPQNDDLTNPRQSRHREAASDDDGFDSSLSDWSVSEH